MCTNMGSGKADLTGIPQSFIDRVLENNPDADLKKVSDNWRSEKARSESHMFSAENIKPGDKIGTQKVMLRENASIGKAEGTAYWNTKRSDGSTSRLDHRDMVVNVTKVEKKGDKVKITAEYDLSEFAIGDTPRKKGTMRTIYRTFNANDTLHRY